MCQSASEDSKAVDQVDLTIEKGQIYGLIGPNGAGKSTLFNCAAGSYAPTSGRILYNGEDITGWNPWNICRKKIARTFQIVKPFQTKTVLTTPWWVLSSEPRTYQRRKTWPWKS